MKYVTIRATLPVIAFLASTGALQAMEINHEDVDLNADGMVTEAEIITVMKTHFLKMDKDADNGVSKAEWLNADVEH